MTSSDNSNSKETTTPVTPATPLEAQQNLPKNPQDSPVTTPVSQRRKRKLTGLTRSTEKLAKKKFFDTLPEPVDPVTSLLKSSALGPTFKELFALYGIQTIEDFDFFDGVTVDSLQAMIRDNGFQDTADFNCQEAQMKYLGRKLAHGQLSKFSFLPVEVAKMNIRLPAELAKLKEKEKQSRKTVVEEVQQPIQAQGRSEISSRRSLK